MTSPALENDLKAAIRTIPDYPKPGIMFRDITTLLGYARAFRRAVDELVQPWAGMKIDKVAGIEARGFILGGAVAHQVSAGFVPIRKKGKLPHKRVSVAYALEYGEDQIEMHADALVAGERVVLVDDLIATGGTAAAAVKLLRQLGANVLAACFVIDLPELGGADKLRKLDVPVRTLISFEDHDAVTVQDIIKVLLENATRAQRLVARLARDFPREHEPCPIGSDRALDSALITAPKARDPALLKKLDAVAGRVLGKA